MYHDVDDAEDPVNDIFGSVYVLDALIGDVTLVPSQDAFANDQFGITEAVAKADVLDDTPAMRSGSLIEWMYL